MIDVHVHVDIYGQDLPHVLRFMDDDRIDQCVLLSVLPSRYHEGVACTMNWQVYIAYLQHPDRFIPFFVVDPHSKDIERQMELFVELGFRGLGEHKMTDVAFDSPGCKRIYKMCSTLKLPVLFHIGREGFPEAEMAGVEAVIAEFGDVTFIAHSMGWWKQISKEWSTGEHAPIGKVVPGGNVDRMLAKYPNLYADISTGDGLRALARDPQYTEGFLQRHQKKLIFGTDFPAERSYETGRFVNQVLFRKKLMFSHEFPADMPVNYEKLVDMINADPELRRDFTHNNIARILNLPTI